ncbi:hypothetical protein [Nonomuraea endophytica]|uniref:Uncharacterized protein n=1 Tax=Nonomuraea endophytica TaxID=714136 RepID=A0A7W8A4R5_9ACTN|nr:hypothetical protein [Nonomuraea endophytica]MBB5078830.1 hypothetical protein [Nonomuraea endophytica]
MALDEVTRQLQLAGHDAQVAFDCVGLGHLDRAHTHVVTAKAALDAAEVALRHALETLSPTEAAREGALIMDALEEQEAGRQGPDEDRS